MKIRERYARRREKREPKTLDSWAQDWTRAAGFGIIIAWILPFISRHGGMYFFFQYIDDFNGWEGIAEFLMLQLGVLAILAAGHLKGWRLGSFLFFSAMAVLLVRVWAESPTSGWTLLFSEKSRFAFWAVAILASAVTVIAGANHVVRRNPDARAGWRAMALAGLAVLLAFLVPFDHHGSLLTALAKAETWELAWPTGLVLVLLFLYGVMALAALTRLEFVPGLLRQMLRVIALSAPLLFILQATVVIGGSLGNGEILIAVVKIALLAYGHLILLAVSLALWLDPETAAAARRDRGRSRLRRSS